MASPRSTLRRATSADEPFLRRMVYEALFVPPGGRPFPESVLDEPDISHYYRGFGRAGDVGRVAVSDTGAPSGAAWVRQLTAGDPGYGYVDDDTPELTIAVSAPHRGAGLGSALLADLLLEVPRCSLSVDPRNPALALYERFGFETVGDDGHSITMLRTSPAAGVVDVAVSIAGPSLDWGLGTMLPEGIAVLGDEIIARSRRRVVELGSGLSTVLLARLMTRRSADRDWRLVAVEHDATWARRVRDELDREGVRQHVTIVDAPLGQHALALDGLEWYDEMTMSSGLDNALGGDQIDLLVVDGPPAFAVGFELARYPALPALRHRLAPGGTVVLDDVDRAGEREVLRRWERELGIEFRRLAPARLAVATI